MGSASALVIYSIRRLELVLGAEVSSIGFNLSLASEERNTISVSEGVSRLSMSCCKEANKKCPSLPHRWQYLVLMARLANQTRHWTYGGLGVSALDSDCIGEGDQLFVNYLSYCQNMIDSPPPSIIVMRVSVPLTQHPPPTQIFQGKSEHPSSSKINPA